MASVLAGMIRPAAGKGGATPPVTRRTASGPLQAWRRALPRALRGQLDLMVEISDLRLETASLDELLEHLPEQGLICLLDGPDEALGLMVLSPGTTAALIEMQTMGHVLSAAPPPRRATRTDAAMVAGVVDQAMLELEQALQGDPERDWALGYRYAAFLDETRSLSLLLEERRYRLISARLTLAEGPRQGEILLALPEASERTQSATRTSSLVAQLPRTLFPQGLEDVECRLEAVLGGTELPLARLLALEVGQVLALPGASLDHVSLLGLDQQLCAMAQLGQRDGMRALRVMPHGQASQDVGALAVSGVAEIPALDPGGLDALAEDHLGTGFAATDLDLKAALAAGLELPPDPGFAIDPALGWPENDDDLAEPGDVPGALAS